MSTLADLQATASQAATGSSIEVTGEVNIQPTETGQPTVIKTTTDQEALKVNDDGTAQLLNGVAVNEILTSFNDSTPNPELALPTIQGVTEYAEADLGNPTADGQVLTSTIAGVRSWVTDTDLVNDTDDITEGSSNLFLTVAERSKLANVPSDANAELADKMDDFGLASASASQIAIALGPGVAIWGSPTLDAIVQGGINKFVGQSDLDKLANLPANTNSDMANKLDINSLGLNVSITNTGTGNGSLRFINDNASVNKKNYEFNPRSGDYLELEANNDNNISQNSFKFHHDGNLEIDGTFVQNGNDVVDVTNSTFANLPADTTSELALKAERATNNNFSSQQGFNNTSGAQLFTKNTSPSTTSAIGHKDLGTGNFRAGTGYDETNDYWFLKVGNQSSFTLLGNRLEVSTTQATFNVDVIGTGDIGINTGNIIGRRKDNHADDGSEIFNIGSIIGTTLTGMRINSVWDGASHNEEEIEFHTHDGGTNAGVRMSIDKAGLINITGDLTVGGTMTQNSNNVLDTSNILTDMNSAAGTLVDTPTIKTYVDSQSGSFNGVRTMSDGTTPAYTAKRNSNLNDITFIASQNIGNNYINRFYVDESDSEKIKIAIGSDPVIANLTDIIEIGTKFQVNNNAFDATSLTLKNTDDTNPMGIGFQKSGGNYGAGIYVEQNGNDTSKYDLILKAGDNADPINMFTLIKLNGLDQEVSITNLKASSSRFTSGILLATGDLDLSTNNAFFHRTASDQGELHFKNEFGSPADLKRYRLYAANSNFKIESLNDAGALQKTWSFNHSGATTLPGNISLKDPMNTTHRIEGTSTAVGGTARGMTLRSLGNGLSGTNIFRVESSGNSPRLHVEHDGILGTSNAKIMTSIGNDGEGGNEVYHQGNEGLRSRAIVYMNTTGTDNPMPSPSMVSDVVGWKGKLVYTIGVGAVVVTLPDISDFGTEPTSTQYGEGETLTIVNYNSGSALSIQLNNTSTTEFIINDLSLTSVGNINLNSGGRMTFTAYDLTSYTGTNSKKTWIASDPSI